MNDLEKEAIANREKNETDFRVCSYKEHSFPQQKLYSTRQQKTVEYFNSNNKSENLTTQQTEKTKIQSFSI